MLNAIWNGNCLKWNRLSVAPDYFFFLLTSPNDARNENLNIFFDDVFVLISGWWRRQPASHQAWTCSGRQTCPSSVTCTFTASHSSCVRWPTNPTPTLRPSPPSLSTFSRRSSLWSLPVSEGFIYFVCLCQRNNIIKKTHSESGMLALFDLVVGLV